ncbi:MAG: BlaI/MecI/CopY family transcriptional regulator [Candidatus Korarchaeota archaeon]|nr:BlaI/MecI/CopY family transcriptional regulator [Candidatus Korarchaeota archaeon]
MGREPLEPKVMEILFRKGEATVREILEEINRDKERKLSLTTVSTVVSRLYRKGLLLREGARGRGGTYYIYRPAVTHEEYERRMVREAVDRLSRILGKVALLRFVEESTSRLDEEELRELLRRIEGRVEK